MDGDRSFPYQDNFHSIGEDGSNGPALFAGGAAVAQLWLFWLAPIAGAMIAGVVARILFEDSSIVESVVVEKRNTA